MRYAGAGTDISPIADSDGSNQSTVAADKRTCADHGLVLALAIVVAGDDASSDIRSVANRRVAKIAQVASLGAFAQSRFFHLNEVAHMRLLGHLAAWTQMRKGSNSCIRVDDGIADDAMVAQENPIAERGILQNAARSDQAVNPDARIAKQLYSWLDDRSCANLHPRRKNTLFWTKEHRSSGLQTLHSAIVREGIVQNLLNARDQWTCSFSESKLRQLQESTEETAE